MRKIIFHYHLFKNAGTSVDAILKKNFPGRWVSREFPATADNQQQQIAEWIKENPNAVAFSSHTAFLPPPVIDGVEIFPIIFVRHPIDRIASAYHFEKKQKKTNQSAILAKSTDLSGYIDGHLGNSKISQCRNFQSHRLSRWFNNIDGDITELALQTIEILPFVGLVDVFDESINRLSDWLSPHFPELKMAVVTRNIGRDISLSINDKLKEIRQEIGKARYENLLSVNSADMAVFTKVQRRYQHTLSELDIAIVEARSFASTNARLLPEFKQTLNSLGKRNLINPAKHEQLRSCLLNDIRIKKPLSLIRLGDGEGNVLFWGNRQHDYPTLATLNMTRIWKIMFGKHRGNPEMWNDLYEQMVAAITQASYLGINTPDQIELALDKFKQDNFDIRGLTGTLAVWDWLHTQQPHEFPADQVVTNWRVHKSLLNFFVDLVRCAGNVSVITCYHELLTTLHLYCGVTQGESFIIPPQSSNIKETSKLAHFPTVFTEISSALRAKQRHGELFFVGAGLLGKVYCETIRQMGGMAIDVGSMMDVWIGVGARTYQTAEFVETHRIKAIIPKPIKKQLHELEKVAFICGSPHTGTTILSRILSEHSDVYLPNYETCLFLPKRFLNFEATLARLNKGFASAKNKTVFIEKTPDHVYCIDYIRRVLPNSKFILTTRDCRDVIASFYKRTLNMKSAINSWGGASKATLMQLDMPDVLLVKYEDFIENPSLVMQTVTDFIGIPYQPEMFNYHEHQVLWFGNKELKQGIIDPHKEHAAYRNHQVNQPLFDGRNKWRDILTTDQQQELKTYYLSEGILLMRRLGYSEKQTAWID